MLEKGALAILVLSKASAWFAVSVTGIGLLASFICRPYQADEDKLDILVRLTMSSTCLAGGLMEASAVTGVTGRGI